MIYYYSTYARVVLSDSKPISTLIIKYSQKSSDISKSAGSSPFFLLSEEQIHDALINPQNSLRPAISTYAMEIQTHREIYNLTHEIHQQKRVVEETILQLRNRYNQADTKQKEALVNGIQILEEQFKSLTKMQENIDDFKKQIKDLEKQAQKLTFESDDEWEDYREQTIAELAKNLQEANIPLSEIEKNELEAKEIWTEVLKRFKDLNLEVPKYINLSKVTFTTYFELKAYLAIHSSLSRRMLPHSSEDIKKL